MVGRWNLLILALHLFLPAVLSQTCRNGYDYDRKKNECIDVNECEEVNDNNIGLCRENAACHNTVGSFYCTCIEGFYPSLGGNNFSANSTVKCRDINECTQEGICGSNAKCENTSPYYSCICEDGFISTTGNKSFSQGERASCIDIDECQGGEVCDQNATCHNIPGSYECVCKAGFGLRSGKSKYTGNQEQCEDICTVDKTICGNGTCHRGADGHYCACHSGFTNYGYKAYQCTELNCDVFRDTGFLKEKFRAAYDLVVQLRENCMELTERENPTQPDGEDLLKRLLNVIDELLSSGVFKDNRTVSTFLDLVEHALKLVGPFMKPPGTNRTGTHTELQLLIHKGDKLPQGAKTLSTKHAQLDIQMETAAGDLSSYPGFATVSMLSYANLEKSADGFFSGIKHKEDERLQINSRVVTVSVSNTNTSHLQKPVVLTLYHLKKQDQSNHTCVFWDSSKDGGTWSPKGCSVVKSNDNYTVCSCSHLSSFAVLMARHDLKDRFELKLITWVGLSLSLICLFICILTFWFIRSIQSPRTTIHLHLCISLFIANLIFLAGISRTENPVGCAVVAGFLHFFYLAAFCWMCLEGIQLFRMVVLVFNTSFRTLYIMAAGYGVPALIVAVSAMVNAKGYGTKKHCWLNLDFIWSFFGPVCVIIVMNIIFFLITAWKLAEKFSSLNPDLDKLQKVKAFTITAVAQLCVLGIMWIFGCFQFEEGTIVMTYLFTIFGSLQGVMLFVMHCLFSKQVREEYANILSRFCAPKKKRYSEFTSTQSSKAQTSKSNHDTGESQI